MGYLLYRIAEIVDPNTIGIPKVEAGQSQVQVVLQFVFGLAAVIAVIVITLAGFNYVISNGDSQKTAKAKDTILYAIVGLVISLLAFTIVTFVIGRLV